MQPFALPCVTGRTVVALYGPVNGYPESCSPVHAGCMVKMAMLVAVSTLEDKMLVATTYYCRKYTTAEAAAVAAVALAGPAMF